MLSQNLKKIDGDARINSLLVKLRDHDLKCYIWRFIGDRKILAQVRVTAVRKFKKDFTISPYSSSEKENYNHIIGTTEEVNFYVANDLIIFRAKLSQIETQLSIILKNPEFFAQAERRKHLRLPTYSSEMISAKFSKCILFPRFQIQYFQKKCFDISAGGASIIVSKIEGKYFQVDDEVPHLEIVVGGRIINVDVKVVATQELLPGYSDDILYKVQRINFKFMKISKPDFEFLRR